MKGVDGDDDVDKDDDRNGDQSVADGYGFEFPLPGGWISGRINLSKGKSAPPRSGDKKILEKIHVCFRSDVILWQEGVGRRWPGAMACGSISSGKKSVKVSSLLELPKIYIFFCCIFYFHFQFSSNFLKFFLSVYYMQISGKEALEFSNNVQKIINKE